MRELGPLVVSALARVEVPAALWRKVRSGALAAASVERVLRAFVIDLTGGRDERPRFGVVDVLPTVLDRAAMLAGSRGLRAYDAVQLASALAARDADPSCTAFACFDDDLRAAAAADGFELVP